MTPDVSAANTILHVYNYKGIADASFDLSNLFEGIIEGKYPFDASDVLDLIHIGLFGVDESSDDLKLVKEMPIMSKQRSIGFELTDDVGNTFLFERCRSREYNKDEYLRVLKNGKPVSTVAIDGLLEILSDTVEMLIHKHLHDLDGLDKLMEEHEKAQKKHEKAKKKKHKLSKKEKKKFKKEKEKLEKKHEQEIETYELSEGWNIEAYEKNIKKGYKVTKKTKKKKKVLVYIKQKVVDYERDLRKLQIELLKYQNHIIKTNKRVMCIFEGRDTAGKGGVIKRFTAHLNPRNYYVVALEKPTDVEQTQWYFQRYIDHLPSAGQIVFFDRSRYNRAMVEPVMGFCTEQEHRKFLNDVTKIEKMIVEDGVIFHKFFFSISKDEQKKRLDARREDPLKQYKISPVDKKAQDYRNKYTMAKYEMLLSTDKPQVPWTIVDAESKKIARLNAMKYVLCDAEYEGKTKDQDFLTPHPLIVRTGAEEINMMQEKFKTGLNYFD